MSLRAWLEVAERLRFGSWENLRCAECNNDLLDVSWLPGPDGSGEYRLSCATCGTVILVQTNG